MKVTICKHIWQCYRVSQPLQLSFLLDSLVCMQTWRQIKKKTKGFEIKRYLNTKHHHSRYHIQLTEYNIFCYCEHLSWGGSKTMTKKSQRSNRLGQELLRYFCNREVRCYQSVRAQWYPEVSLDVLYIGYLAQRMHPNLFYAQKKEHIDMLL